ncbi:MAG: sulfatase [Acidobacteria bacterium]|nr:sulfatase [Acidobacteriota bacterium]
MRTRLPFVLAGLVVLVGVAAGPARDTGAAQSKPNVLFIAVDDLNDWVGPLGGHPQVRTPNIDRLAARGTTFVNAHVQAPLCNSSRTSFLTGLRPSTTGVYALNPWFRESDALRQRPTVLQTFMRGGYRTMTTGKIFHDGYPPAALRDDGSEVGTWGFLGGFAPRPPQRLVPGPLTNPLVDWGVFPERDEQQDDYRVAQWAVEQLTRPSDQPFFLGVGIRHPHVPLYATQRWFDLYPDETLQLPPYRADDRDDVPRFAWYLNWKLPEPRLAWLEQAGQWKSKVRSYLASISFADHMVGLVLDALEASDEADNTIVVLFSDHGYHLGEKGITGKNTLWERSTRVPLIFAGPGITRGAKVAEPAELLDMYPTLALLAGLPTPEGLEGHSLVPQLRNPSTPRDAPAITTQGPGNHGIRDRRYRYIRYADGSEELYDLQRDPNEWTNLASDGALLPVKQRLASYLPSTNVRPVAGSRVRLIDYVHGVPIWEGAPIGANDPIPGP